MSKRTILIIAGSVTTLCLIVPLVLIFYFSSTDNDIPGIEVATHEPNQPPRPTLPTTPTQEPDPYIPDQFTIAPAAIGLLSITPIESTSLGIARGTAFLISSETQPLTEAHLQSYLSIPSGESFTLEAQPDDTFLLRFANDLSPAQIYNIVYSPPQMQPVSHAFQTVDIFRITATTPATATHSIPTDSGIEVTFNQALANAYDFRDAFVIYPPVEGRFYQRENTHIFAPNELAPGIEYTVTIRPGLTGITGEVLEEAYSFMFTTRWGTATAREFSIAGRAYTTFLPWQQPVIPINASNAYLNRDFIVSIYDLQTPENFINFSGDKGEPIYELTLQIYTSESHRAFHHFLLGRYLQEGYYLATITSPIDGMVLQKFIQVSALSVYSLSVAGETVFWVHDATTHQPAAGAEVSIGDTVVTTNHEGIAIAPVAETSRLGVTISYGNYLPFAYTTRTFAPTRLTPNRRFLTYLYTDRPTYRPNDTIDVFGVIKPRYGQAHLPGDVFTLHIGDMLQLPITLDAYHAFNKRVPVTGMFGGVELRVDVNGERLMSTWLNFVDYTNLSFVLGGNLERNAYFGGEYAQVEVSVTNFAGTPAEGVALTRNWQEATDLVTNENGIAAGQLRVDNAHHWSHWQLVSTSMSLSTASDTAQSQHIRLPFIVAPRDIMLEVYRPNDHTAVLTSSRITLDKLNASNSPLELMHNPDNFRGESVDVDFTVTITRYVTTRTVRSQRYDHIRRRTITTYNFDTTSSATTRTGRTQNGTAVVENLPTSTDPLIRYRIVVTYNDSRGVDTHVGIGSTNWISTEPWIDTSVRHFNFRLSEGDNQYWWETRLGVGETTNVVLLEGDVPWWNNHGFVSTPTTGRVLAVMVRDRVISATVGSPQGTPITFTEDAISNAIIFGAYFDAGYIFPIPNPLSVLYDSAERNLQIDFEFCQEEYRPGGDITVQLQTRNRDGNPVPAQVTLSVVDESAIFGWAEHRPRFLSQLYSSSWITAWWDFDFYQFASYTQQNFDGSHGGAEGGDGGYGGTDPGFRDRFIDNPIFEVVQTDENGIGEFTFTLPHQITSWRVTALGLAEGGLAGDYIENIISTLPFHVDLVLTNEYIVGDDIAAFARVFSSPGTPRSDVTFTFDVLCPAGEVLYSYTQTALRQAQFNAGKLEAGAYTMRVAAVMGNYRDGMELPFTVTESPMILRKSTGTKIVPVDFEIPNLEMRDLPVQVTLTNANIRPLTNILHGTLNHDSSRTDHIAAAAFVRNFHSGATDYGLAAQVRAQVHAQNGGISELTYELSNHHYTARFAASFPEFVCRDSIVWYARTTVVEWDHPYYRAATLLALAAVGEPVLLDIWAEIEQLPAETGYQTTLRVLHLAAALIAAGDYIGAYNLMHQRPVPPNLNLSNQGRERINTALLFINSAIDPQAAWEYLRRGHVNRYISDIPERINFVRRAVVAGDTVSEVEYYLNGETHNIRLENFDRVNLHISRSQFENLNLTHVNGETDLFIDFYAYSAQLAEADNRIDIERSIERAGELYRITLRVNTHGIPGCFAIYDRLPSNMRFVPTRDNRCNLGRWFFVQNTQRQLMEIRFHRGINDRGGERTFTYYAMKLFDGDMATGTTYVSHNSRDGQVWGWSR